MAVQNHQVSAIGLNVDYFSQTFAQDIAGSSMEIGLNRFNKDPGWRTNGTPWIYTIAGESTEIHVDDSNSHPAELQNNQIRIRALSEIDGQNARSETILEFESIFPPIPGAMGFYGQDSELDIRGNVNVNGHDMNPDGTEGDEASVPGIAAAVEQDSLLDTSGQAYELDGDPPYSQQAMDGAGLQSWIDLYLSVADEYVAPNIGSVEFPEIVKMPAGTTKISDQLGGAGIIIIPPGATLELRGDFVYQGLIIVQGALDIAGNVEVYGSALFGDNSLLEIDEVDPNDATLKGNAMMQFSGSALENVDQALGALLSKGFFITGILE